MLYIQRLIYEKREAYQFGLVVLSDCKILIRIEKIAALSTSWQHVKQDSYWDSVPSLKEV